MHTCERIHHTHTYIYKNTKTCVEYVSLCQIRTQTDFWALADNIRNIHKHIHKHTHKHTHTHLYIFNARCHFFSLAKSVNKANNISLVYTLLAPHIHSHTNRYEGTHSLTTVLAEQYISTHQSRRIRTYTF